MTTTKRPTITAERAETQEKRAETQEKLGLGIHELLPGLDPERAKMMPIEYVREIAERAVAAQHDPKILIELATPEEALAYGLKLVDASIKSTFPEDWVVFRSKDGHKLCFLQDVGCDRITGLWGISFDKLDRQRDVTEIKIPGENDEDIAYEVIISGYCERTRQSLTEIGFRASTGFFERNWKAAKGKDVERRRIATDILKSAIANGQGRLIRSLAGMGQMPIDRLKSAGFDERRLRGADFQSGTKGGSGAGAGASEPQIKAIVDQAYQYGKVANLGARIGKQKLEELVRGAGLTGGSGGTASALIKMLGEAQKGGVTIEAFEKALGVACGAPEPGEEG